jgi:hypothetical protein
MALALYLLSSVISSVHADESLQSVESEYGTAIKKVYLEETKKTHKQTAPYAQLTELHDNVKIALAQGKPLLAIQYLSNNSGLVSANVNSAELLSLFSTLLSNEMHPLAEQLLDTAKQSGASAFALSSMHYELANYYFSHDNRVAAQQQLTQIQGKDTLSAEKTDYATLLFGIILQYQKNHRAALKFYDEVAPTSPYYAYAQLNKATVYIRQGWWTDAQTAIENAFNAKTPAGEKELNNRLYLVLGYSQLSHEFYRDARESFRHITLDSQYKDRALLGIGLCALNQEDYAGALNAFETLKAAAGTDVSSTESYLLAAYTNEQNKQKSAALALYTEAITYYQKRIQEAHEKLANTPAHDELKLQSSVARLNILLHLAEQVNDKSRSEPLTTLGNKYAALLSDAKKSAAQGEINILTSYLSQAQFGQAQIYDNERKQDPLVPQ